MLHTMKGKPRLLLLVVCITMFSSTRGGEGNTWQDELRIYSADIALQCSAVKEQLAAFKAGANALAGYTLKDAVQSLCVCLPEKIHALKHTLSPDDLTRAITADEFLARFNPAVIDQCAAEQIQTIYGAECPKRFKTAGLNERKYCACMKVVVDGYSGSVAAAIAAEAAEYLPRAAEAEQKAEQVPPRPPVLEAYYQADQGCKAK
jgi:hypothetical protein